MIKVASHRAALACLAGAGLAFSMIAGPASADNIPELAPLHQPPTADDSGASEQASGLWFVELESPPASQGVARAQLQREKRQFRANARAQGVRFSERMAFDRLWNGLSIELESDLATLRETPGVRGRLPGAGGRDPRQ